MNPSFNTNRIFVPGISLGALRLAYSRNQTPENLSPALIHRLSKTWHRHLTDSTQHTLWYGTDGGIIAYRVPREMLNHDYRQQLNNSITTLTPPKTLTLNIRGIESKIYQIWAPSRLIPDYSADYIKDGDNAAACMLDNTALWNDMSFIFQNVWKSEARIFKKYPLPNNRTRLAGAWTGCAVNIGTHDRPVQTEIHRDVNEGPFGISCLCPFGDVTGGDVILWEACLQIQLRAGDLLFFSDGILHHSNQAVEGQRHSLVTFTPINVFDYWKRKYNYQDPRITSLKIRKQKYRQIKEDMGKMKLIQKSKNRKQKVRINHKKLIESCKNK
jgi:hypothetical protein